MFNYDFSYYYQKHYKTVVITSIILFVCLIVGLIAYQYKLSIERQGKIAVPMQVVPSDAEVYLDNTERLSSDTVYITSGTHDITVKKAGFSTVTKSYRIKTYNEPAIYISLVGESEDAKKWQQAHNNEYKKLEVLAAEQAAKYSQSFSERNPIVKALPVKDPYFTISYRNVDDESVRLTIWGTSPRYREFAIDHLRKIGFEPTDYEIEFTGFKNPLGDTQ
jgi:hypothetical protein